MSLVLQGGVIRVTFTKISELFMKLSDPLPPKIEEVIEVVSWSSLFSLFLSFFIQPIFMSVTIHYPNFIVKFFWDIIAFPLSHFLFIFRNTVNPSYGTSVYCTKQLIWIFWTCLLYNFFLVSNGVQSKKTWSMNNNLHYNSEIILIHFKC